MWNLKVVGWIPKKSKEVQTLEKFVVILSVTLYCVSIVSGILVIFFTLRNNKKTDTKDIEERVKANTQLNMKLDEISRTTSDTRSEITSINRELTSYNEKLARVDESTRSAHLRIDTIEQRLNNERE